MKLCVFLVLILVFSPTILSSTTPKLLGITPSQNIAKTANNLKYDLCPFCVNFLGQVFDNLINAILNAGVLGTCGAVCSQLPNQLEQVACDLLCDYVGIEAFIDLVNYEDPDPIYVCQYWDVCNHTEGGQVTIHRTFVTPPKGPAGTTFVMSLQYTVVKATSVGGIEVAVYPPDSFPFGGGAFVEGQAPGNYEVDFELQAVPSEQEPLNPGVYQVFWAICAGDCSTSHPWGGVYAESNTTFSITG